MNRVPGVIRCEGISKATEQELNLLAKVSM